MRSCPKCQTIKALSEFYFRSGRRAHKPCGYCKICSASMNRIYRKADPERVRVRDYKYQKKPSTRARINQNRRNRYASNPAYRIESTLRSRIGLALRGVQKASTTRALLGCPTIWFQIHIASLFKSGMSWTNHGSVWEIDHIRPCASFDLTDPVQQRRCFHWTNTQPLLKTENREKSDFYHATPRQPPQETCSRYR